MPTFRDPIEMIDAMGAHVAQPVGWGSAHYLIGSHWGPDRRFTCRVCAEEFTITEHDLFLRGPVDPRLPLFRLQLETLEGMRSYAHDLQMTRGYQAPPMRLVEGTPPGVVMHVGDPVFVGAMPVRMDLQILPADGPDFGPLPSRTEIEVIGPDDPTRPPLGIRMIERLGVGVINMNGVRNLVVSRDEIPPPPKPPCSECGAVDHQDHVEHLTRFERELLL